MGFDLKKAAIKSLLPMVEDFLPMLDQAIEDYRNEWAAKISLQEGDDVVAILFSREKRTYINICVLSADDQVKQQLVVMLFSDFVMKLIAEFKKS